MTRLSITRRDLRLASGLTLLCYLGLHMLNHALGLVSLAAAEQGLRIAVAVWHSLPGSMLLYGALGTHLALALLSLYERCSLRLPPAEWLRIGLGLAFPLILIGHVTATRIAAQAYGLPPEYSRVVAALWAAGAQGPQLAFLAPGWLHGCMGVYFAFSRRPQFRRIALPLFALALLLPVLAALGFVAMGRELAAPLSPRAPVPAEVRAGLDRTRETALNVYFALLAAVVLARWLRAAIARSRNRIVRIAYPTRTVTVPMNWSVLEASRAHGIAHVSMCTGRARCSTCRVQVVRGEQHCPPPGEDERATLARIGDPPGVRLACQLRPAGDIAVVPLIAATADRGAAGAESRAGALGGAPGGAKGGAPAGAKVGASIRRSVGTSVGTSVGRSVGAHAAASGAAGAAERWRALLTIELPSAAHPTTTLLPHDHLYLLRQYASAAMAVLRAHDARPLSVSAHRISVLFSGPARDATAGERAAASTAMSAAAALLRLCEDLNRQWHEPWGVSLQPRITLHGGMIATTRLDEPVAASGSDGHAPMPIVAAGDALRQQSQLHAMCKAQGCRLVYSESLLQAAGLQLAEQAPPDAQRVVVTAGLSGWFCDDPVLPPSTVQN